MDDISALEARIALLESENSILRTKVATLEADLLLMTKIHQGTIEPEDLKNIPDMEPMITAFQAELEKLMEAR